MKQLKVVVDSEKDNDDFVQMQTDFASVVVDTQEKGRIDSGEATEGGLLEANV